MKNVLFLIIVFVQISFSQVLQWTPYFATRNDVITIDYDCSKGNGALMNVFPIYIHTGVITNLSSHPNDWRYVKTVWGQPTNQPTMTYLGNYIWRFTINIPQYYGVPQSEEILKLAFVFRNADGSKVGRDADGSDIFLPIYQPGLNVRFLTPAEKGKIFYINTNFTITAVSSQSSNLKLFINDSLIAQTDTQYLSKTIFLNRYGKFYLKAVAEDSLGNQKTDSTYYIVQPAVTIAQLPAGVVDGINYIDSTSVILSLYAPYKNYAYVIGDFTNWEIEPEFYMKKTPDGNRFWIQINNLEPGVEYGYQYLIDGTLKIADPYAEKLLDPWNDQYIPSITYPNLKPYPFGKTTHLVSVLQTSQTKYNWQITNFQRPDKKNLIIYELLIRDFVARHDYKTLADTLNYLKQLGINAIELMPINEFEGNESWGYNTTFYFAPDKYYGTKNDLKAFIDKAHQLGIAVILDVVFNHNFGQSSLVRMYWDNANERPAANSPWFNPIPRHPYNVGYDFNHESPATKQLVARVLRHWIEEYKIDGFRFDLSKGFTQTNSGNDVGLWGQYDQSRINILKGYADSIWAIDSSIYVILEHFAVDQEEQVLANYGMLLWGNLNYNYNEATMGWHDGGKSNFSRISYKTRGFSQPHLVGYMESHDEERLMYKNLMYGNSSGTYNIKSLNTALERMKLAGAFFFTVPGPKMIWQFGELGYDITIEYNGRTAPKPIRWDYFNNIYRNKLYKTFATLINLKKSYRVFNTNNFTTDFGPSVKRFWLNDDSMNVTILGNFDVTAKTTTANFQHTGWWYNYFYGDSLNVTNTSMEITLQPGEFRIYTSKRLPPPEPGLLTPVEYSDEILPSKFTLYQNYPNPFNPVTYITYDLPVDAYVTLKVYDVLGKEVITLVDEYQKTGVYIKEFDINRINGINISSGVYIYKLKANDFVSSKKLLLLK